MPQLVHHDKDNGSWITFYDDYNTLIFSGHWPTRRTTTPLTVFWRGNTDDNRLITFFDMIKPGGNTIINALIFTLKDRLRLDRLKDTQELRDKLPPDARFLRIESASPTGEPVSYEPDFIVWSRIDQPPKADNIGVWLTPSRLADFSSQIAEFITDTHVDPKLNYGTTKQGIDMLINNLYSR